MGNPICFFVALSLLLTPRLFGQAVVPQDLDSYVERALTTFNAPGLAIAIVKDGKMVFAKGYGVRRVGFPGRVDEHTLFQIGSTTKAFTAATLATLVDQGKLKWDEPVRTYLPWFEMYDPYVAKQITTRDLLSHRSGLGLGEGDLLMFPESDYSRRELISRMKFLRPSSSFRSEWAYCNLCVLAASELIPELTGHSWEEYVKANLFLPLGNSTRVSLEGVSELDNVAFAHELVDSRVVPVSWQRTLHWTNLATIAPVGSAVSNVVDISEWITLELNHGAMPGTNNRIFSEEQSREMWKAACPIDIDVEPLGLEAAQKHFFQSGLGWLLWDYRGGAVIEHSGGTPGNTTEIVLLPEHNAGFVIFVNSPSEFPNEIDAVERKLMDAILGFSETDWIAKYANVRNSRRKQAQELLSKNSASRKPDSRPSLPPRSYAGVFNDPWFGDVRIDYVDEALIFRAARQPGLTGKLDHWQNDSFVVHWQDPLVPPAYIYFALAPDGSINQFKMSAFSPPVDFSFDFQDLLFRPKTAQ